MSANAAIRVAFGGGASASGHLSAEIDNRPEGLNQGKTAFQPGDTAWFLVHASRNVTVERPLASAGSILNATVGTVIRTDDIFFENSSTATLPVPADSLQRVTWFGHPLGALTLGPDQLTVTAAQAGVAVARVVYATSPKAFGVKSPVSLNGSTDFGILVLVTGSVAQ